MELNEKMNRVTMMHGLTTWLSGVSKFQMYTLLPLTEAITELRNGLHSICWTSRLLALWFWPKQPMVRSGSLPCFAPRMP